MFEILRFLSEFMSILRYTVSVLLKSLFFGVEELAASTSNKDVESYTCVCKEKNTQWHCPHQYALQLILSLFKILHIFTLIHNYSSHHSPFI
jgi:uncharacterized protein YqhQ